MKLKYCKKGEGMALPSIFGLAGLGACVLAWVGLGWWLWIAGIGLIILAVKIY